MWVIICPDRYDNDATYNQIGLELPTYQEALDDALQKARVSSGTSYHLSYMESWPLFIYDCLQMCDATLEQADLLAYKLSQMESAELEQYETIVEYKQVKTIKDLINASYNLNNFEFITGLMDVAKLGEMAIVNDWIDILEDLPDEVYPLLAVENVGKYAQNKMHGIFTSKGYCYRISDEWIEIYDGITIPEQLDGECYIFSLFLHPWKGGTQGVWLKLPYDSQDKEQVLDTLGIDSLKDCQITKIRSAVPMFEYTIGKDTDIEHLNQFAKELDALTTDERIKYKAIVESDAYGGLERAMELLYHMDLFEFNPEQYSYASYGRECLKKLGVDLDAEVFRDFDFGGYGERQLIQNGMVLTSYGLIVCDPSFREEPDNSLHMGFDL